MPSPYSTINFGLSSASLKTILIVFFQHVVQALDTDGPFAGDIVVEPVFDLEERFIGPVHDAVTDRFCSFIYHDLDVVLGGLVSREQAGLNCNKLYHFPGARDRHFNPVRQRTARP
jgi:hypothetical protein